MSNQELCRHDLTVGTCTICKMDGRPVVYITAGGLHFHRTKDCANLASGQLEVEARGGTAARIEGLHPGSQRLADRKPCKLCYPDGY
jgi:hypothetical protein